MQRALAHDDRRVGNGADAAKGLRKIARLERDAIGRRARPQELGKGNALLDRARRHGGGFTTSAAAAQ